MPAPEFVIVGRIRRAHGIRGELVVETISDEPAAIFAAGRRVLVGDADGELPAHAPALTMDAVRPFGAERLLIRFEGIDDRSTADRWRDRFLLARASELVPPAEGEAYLHELPGMHVVLGDGTVVGVVREVFELPQGYMADVTREEGSVMVPLHDAFLVAVDRAARRIVVNLPDGLLE